MKKIIICIILALPISFAAKAQNVDYDNIGRHGIYTEVYFLRHSFNSGFVSLNYEFFPGQKKRISVRAGFYPDFKTLYTFPVTCTWVTHPLKNHHIEFGLGFVYRIEFYNGEVYHDIPALMIPIMYRYQRNKGFFLRAGINLFYSWPILPSPSLSVGYKL